MWIKGFDGSLTDVVRVSVRVSSLEKGSDDRFNVIGHTAGGARDYLALNLSKASKDEVMKDIEESIISGAVLLDLLTMGRYQGQDAKRR